MLNLQLLWHKIAGLKYAYYRLNALFMSENDNNQERLLSDIIQHYHVLEKGLTMPDLRLGFGKQNLIELCQLIKKYPLSNYPTNQINYAVQAIREYKLLHEKEGFNLSDDLVNYIDDILSLFPSKDIITQINMTKKDFFDKSNDSFFEFSHSRHTCRHLDGEISDDVVIDALHLAQDTSPSACNRQSVKVKYLKNHQLIQSILQVQKGNRGFGHTFDKMIILTSDLSYWNYVTFYGGYVDGGIYLMNLLYSLHYYHIGACTLNSYFTKSDDIKVRKLLNIPNNEVFVAIIGLGNVKEHISLARSGRKDVNEVLTIY